MKPKNRASCSGAARLASSLHVVASCSVQQPVFWAFRVLGGRSGLSEMILLMYLIVVMLYKPLETSNELD